MNQSDTLSPAPCSYPFRFSVITAAYNAAVWINGMLESVVGQSLDFSKFIQIIVVDDGSTDQTTSIVSHWATRFPNNIKLIRQSNGGPGAARNRGLEEARGEWLSFIDADDFVAPDYFKAAHDYLTTTAYDGHVVACNHLLFFDPGNHVSNSHPLAYKFSKTQVANLLESPEFIQLFANSCLLRHSSLKQGNIRFDKRIKPTFEDAHFLNTYLLILPHFCGVPVKLLFCIPG